jgi:hypothetical protein
MCIAKPGLPHWIVADNSGAGGFWERGVFWKFVMPADWFVLQVDTATARLNHNQESALTCSANKICPLVYYHV